MTLINDGTLAIEAGGPVTKDIVVDSNGDGHGGILAYASSDTIASQVTINGAFFDATVDDFESGTVPVADTLTLAGKLTGPGGLTAHVSPNGSAAVKLTRLGTVAIT